MINIGQNYRIINSYENILNGIIVKVIKYEDCWYLCEIVDKSLLDNPRIQWYFHNNDEYENRWYQWFNEEYLKSLRSEKLKRLLK